LRIDRATCSRAFNRDALRNRGRIAGESRGDTISRILRIRADQNACLTATDSRVISPREAGRISRARATSELVKPPEFQMKTRRVDAAAEASIQSGMRRRLIDVFSENP